VWLLAILLCVSMFIIPDFSVKATEVTDYAYGDSWVKEDNPNGIYGGSVTLYLRDEVDGAKRAFLDFDLTSIHGIVTSAILTIKRYAGGGGSGYSTHFSLYRTTSFDESTLTWNNMPAQGAYIESTTGFPIVSEFTSVNLTNYVNQQVGSHVYFIFRFDVDNSPDPYYNYYDFRSSEYTVEADRPTLVVNYIPNYTPTNDACDSDGTFAPNVYGWSNMTVSDADGVADLKTVDIQVTTSGSKVFTLRWTQSTGVFSEVSDPDNICTLNVSGSTRTNIDSDTDLISFNFNISTAASSGYCSVKATTKDDLDIQDVDTYPAEFFISSFYDYTFYGLYDENTGLLKPISERAVNVTAFWDDGTMAETFEVNGTHKVGYCTSPQYFIFDLGATDREYWLSSEEGEATTVDIYIFTDSLTSYTLTFRDWTGALSTYSWVNALRYINGTSVVMDKRKVDEQNKVIMALQEGKTYTIQVEAIAGTRYIWGDLAVASDTTIDLVVKGLTFPQDVILTYRYVRAYGYRENYNTTHDSIVHLYEDTILNTDSVNISIYDGDDALIHSYECSDTDSFTYTWSVAVNTTSYYSVVTISHGDYGTLIFRQSFLRGFKESPFDLSFLGSLPGGISVSTLLPMGILLVVTLSFSALTAGIGGVIVVVLAGVMHIIGWVDIDANTLVFAAILAVIYAVLKNYKRVTER